jgi:hypothetical protein
MMMNPPSVDNLTLVELDLFDGITGKSIINQPTTCDQPIWNPLVQAAPRYFIVK